ncbi:hypothetical protein CEXT_294031 [Caerostris extrusa]|uniref:Uncharacterized protein n=1 Tax=Caerostris extrusa TaxID=172846 RepID=A0AAV4M4G0_CAEEX|nr:hypothetical protein CEXT_294031 [Caerostris extrusa]
MNLYVKGHLVGISKGNSETKPSMSKSEGKNALSIRRSLKKYFSEISSMEGEMTPLSEQVNGRCFLQLLDFPSTSCYGWKIFPSVCKRGYFISGTVPD